MALPEQDNDKEDIWLEYTESVVKRRKLIYLSPSTLWTFILFHISIAPKQQITFCKNKTLVQQIFCPRSSTKRCA